MAIISTGSLLVGLSDGMAGGVLPSGTAMMRPNMTYVMHNPDGYLTCITGSDVAYSIGDAKFYIGDVANGPGGSTWTEIK